MATDPPTELEQLKRRLDAMENQLAEAIRLQLELVFTIHKIYDRHEAMLQKDIEE